MKALLLCILLVTAKRLAKLTGKQQILIQSTKRIETVIDIRAHRSNSSLIDSNGDEMLVDDSKNYSVNSTHAKVKNLMKISETEYDM